jgi:hypothetical protein
VELAVDIAACEERLTLLHSAILVLMDKRDGEQGTGDAGPRVVGPADER